MTVAELARMIDHTLLKPEASAEDILRLCEEALQWGFYAVCVQPSRVSLAVRRLEGSPVKVATVVGFPHGATITEAKTVEARRAVAEGAAEVDMVMNLGLARDGDWAGVEADIRAVVEAVPSTPVKVILETCLWDEARLAQACQVAERAGARFVKTSTGFSSGGATVEAVRLMRQSVSAAVLVKASGGIRDLATALRLVEAGAARLGMSASVAVLEGLRSGGGY